jgi:hypothetical protein
MQRSLSILDPFSFALTLQSISDTHSLTNDNLIIKIFGL